MIYQLIQLEGHSIGELLFNDFINILNKTNILQINDEISNIIKEFIQILEIQIYKMIHLLNLNSFLWIRICL